VTGRVALVTGASRGIGRAIALGLAAAGVDVAVGYHRNRGAAEEVARAVGAAGQRAAVVEADVAQVDAGARLVDGTVEALGGLHVLVNNAGGNTRTPFLEIGSAELEAMLALNLLGPFRVAQAAARHMVRSGGGRIVNVASISASVAYPGLSHYQAAKAGIAMLTRGMALELAAANVTVNAVAPGLIETDLTAANLADPDVRARRTARVPMGRLGRPEDVVGAVLYLVSDAAAWVTGTTVVVDGGQTIQA
jgi:NAD(P)-dependent dehydrogenase (short-subunit alcohol dehydrogenase family)